MSLLDLGPVIFGGNEKIIAFLRQNRLLARIQTCTRYEMMNKNMMSQISLVSGVGHVKVERASAKVAFTRKARSHCKSGY